MAIDLRELPLRPWARWLDVRRLRAETFYVSTDDGVKLAIHHVRARPGAPKREPVMLLHGLGANGFAYLHPDRSLARYLADRGHECFVPELRGAGASGASGWTWDLDDYLTRDLPAILRGIRFATGQPGIRWVGHSMGGLLLCCYAIRHEDHGITRGVAIGSALDYGKGESAFRRIYAARRVIEQVPVVPFGAVSHLLAPLFGRVANPLEAFNFFRANVEPEVVRAVYANGFEWIPISLLLSLATTFEVSGLRSRDGALRYVECASRFRAPLLMLAGSRDVQCPPETVEETARLIGPHVRVAHFGRGAGHPEEYGHFDLIVGRRASTEVWPVIADWLETPSVRPGDASS